jgi:PAS domain S-box-containing protein
MSPFVPLRLKIPILLLVFGLLIIAFDYCLSLDHELEQWKNDARARLDSNGARLSGMAQYFYGKSNLDGMNMELWLATTLPDLRLAMVLDAKDQILLATEDRMRQQSLAGSPLAQAIPLVGRARATMSGQVMQTDEGQSLIGAFPFPLGTTEQIQAAGAGIVIIHWDLSRARRQARSDALRQALIMGSALVLLCLALWGTLHRTLTARVQRLVKATQQIASGNLQTRAGLAAVDELGDISAAIDAMADDLRKHIASERASTERIRRINETLPDMIFINRENQIRYINEAGLKMLGAASADQILGKSPFDILHPDYHQVVQKRISQLLERNESMGVLEEKIIRFDGEVLDVEVVALPFVEPEGPAIQVIMRDISARKQVEKALFANEARMAGIINSAMDAIISVDKQHRIVLFNHAAEKMFGYQSQEMIGQPLSRLIPESFCAAHEEHIRRFGETGVTTRTMGALGTVSGLRRDGEEFPIEASISQIVAGEEKLFTVILRDITEKKKLEAQFLRAQRMESLGTLAGGIAHDLNNVLSPITMGLQMLLMRHTDEFSQKMLSVMATNAERGAAMIKQILSFARGAPGDRITVQPEHLLKEVIKLMRETFPKEIVIKQQSGDDLWPVEGDPTQLHQVMMNLCVNARDAMPRGGELTISLENQTLDGLSARMVPGSAPGNYVMITVADTGEGISSEHLDRIFDPFFTTKEPGKGTGLGLSTVYGIVNAHGGFINVYSKVGKGTQFKVYLPAQATAQIKQEEIAAPSMPVGNGELILVVDDEASIREMTRSALEAFGYRVLTADDGVEAVKLYAQHKDEVQLVLTDMMMPVMDGPTMIRALQSLNPQVSVVGSSGLVEEGKADEARKLGVDCILTKPYSAMTLLETVAQALSQSRGRSAP